MNQPTGQSSTDSERQNTSLRRSFWISCVIAFVLVALCEIGFFNLGHWRTTGLQHATVGKAVIGKGLKHLEGNEYKITDTDTATITVPIEGNAVRVESVRVQVDPNSTRKTFSNAVIALKTTGGSTASGTEWVYSTDSDGVWFDSNNTLSYSKNPASQYILIGKKLHEYKSTAVQVKFTDAKDAVVLFNGIDVNPTIPFKIVPLRLAAEIALAAFFVVFRPKGRVYRMHVNLRSVPQRLVTAGFIVVWSLALIALAAVSRVPEPGGLHTAFMHYMDPDQYQELADALIHGHTWLDLPVDPALTTMDNPYDYFARYKIASQGNHQFYWDHAYYNGHYYCYFGVVPAILAFVPYQLITGTALATWKAIALFSVVATVFGTLLVRRLARDYFPQVSLGIVWLATIAFNLGNCLILYCFAIRFYAVPMAAAIAFVFAGLWFWQISKRKDGTVNGWYVAIGSAIMALNLGTPPQFVATWLLAFPMFWPQITKHRTLFSRKGLGATIAALAPFFVVCIPVLYYNYVRFGSWTDFGAYYNLTGYDLTSHRGSPYQLLLGLFDQWFQPTSTMPRFPFITTVDTALAMPNEPSLGGYFAVFPVALFALLFFLTRQQLRKHGVWAMTIIMVVAAIVITAFDTYTSGTSTRYYGDFGYLVMLCAVFVILAFSSVAQKVDVNDDGTLKDITFAVQRSLSFRTLQTVLLTLLIIMGLINLFGLFATGVYSNWATLRPNLYVTVRSWFIGLTA